MFSETAALDPEPSSSVAVIDRNIEFHLGTKTYNGFSNNSSFGFKLVTLNTNSELAAKHEMPKLSDNLGLDPEFSLGITLRRIGAGLRNLGNTCFLNSVLQCLTYTEPLAAYLQSGKHQYSCRTAGFCALCAIQKHVSRALQSIGRILEPKDLVSNLRCISRKFRNARQEDAHEYMVNLLESMHKCCLPSGVPSESHSAYEKSLVHKIFGGRLRSQVKCIQCSFCSNKFDPFLDLSLEIAKADSLHKALARFTAKEFLDGGASQYQCQECKHKVKALKQLTIHKAPYVLTIHLKRFGSHIQGQKIDKKISFGPTLDLKPFVTGLYDEDLSYTLYGVLVHAGWSTHSGHYYCFVRTSSGMWYSLDDNQVVQVNEGKVLEQKAYMLFYVRDMKNCIAKKPVVVLQKESKVAMNAFENVVNSNIDQQLKGKIPNGSIEKSDGSLPVALSERGTLTGRKSLLKEYLFRMYCSMGVDHVSRLRDAQSEPSPSVPPVKDSVDCSAANFNSSGSQAMLGSTCEVSHCDYSLGDDPKIIGSQKGVSVVQDLDASATELPNCNLPKDSVNKKESGEFVAMPPRCYKNTSNENHSKPADQPQNSSDCVSSADVCGIAATNLMMCDSTAMPTRTIEEASSKKGYSNFAKRSRIEESRVQGSPENSGDSTSLETHGGLQKGTVLHLPTTSESLSNGISNNKESRLKVKGKLFKCQISRMSLSSNIIFGVPFALQKQKQKQKQKPKRRKSHSLQHKNLNFKQLLGKNDSPLDLVQFNSDKSLPLPNDHNANSEREKAECCSNDGDKNSIVRNGGCNDNVAGGVNDDGCKEKVGQNGAMHATVNPSQLRQATVQGPGNSEKERRESRQNSITMTMLEETTVARWDGIDVFLPENMKPKSEPSQIGYVGDEWDEEYDRGKRKKIRGPKISYDKPNLFQEIATRNAKRKRAKLHRSNFANQPFRI
ncbi:LOW QUALITY PROTEIN: uncharacterized protein LOC142546197 [Primulina tabacum]|uniref:LOW QUALITY PROTEIN: uncharacterized protein LOC142546197 n=1 Tax=Primulina tabacum TaxID=48773 RepID=UPI003F5A8985